MSAPMPFRFGVQTFNTVSAADWREQAVRAEGQGYDVLSVADHYIGAGPALEAAAHPVQDIACIPAMATALAATSTLRVGSRVIACDYHHPVVLAKSLVTLDYLSDGRFEPGLGAGWITSEYEAMGIEMMSAGRRIDKLVEVIDLVRATYRPGELDIDGEYVHAVGFEATPRPVQPAPPIMVGGGSPRVLGLAGRHADIVSINFDNSEGKLGAVGVGSGFADKTHEKIGWIREGAGDRFADIEIEIGAYFTVVTDDREAGLAAMARRFGMPPELLENHMHTVVGSVDEICDQLVRRREEYGISYITVGRVAADDFAPVVGRLAGT